MNCASGTSAPRLQMMGSMMKAATSRYSEAPTLIVPRELPWELSSMDTNFERPVEAMASWRAISTASVPPVAR